MIKILYFIVLFNFFVDMHFILNYDIYLFDWSNNMITLNIFKLNLKLTWLCILIGSIYFELY